MKVEREELLERAGRALAGLPPDARMDMAMIVLAFVARERLISAIRISVDDGVGVKIDVEPGCASDVSRRSDGSVIGPYGPGNDPLPEWRSE